MKWKGVIFDLDGVLIHTDTLHFLAWKRIADSLGIKFDEAAGVRLRGVSRMESLKILLETGNKSLPQGEMEALAEKKNQYYVQLLESLSPQSVDSSVRETLQKLREKGVLLSVGSSSKNAGYILDRTGLRQYFDAVSDGNNIVRSKPDPEVFLKACGFLGLQPNECLVVEDAPSGIAAAKAAGMSFAGIGEALSESIVAEAVSAEGPGREKTEGFLIKDVDELYHLVFPREKGQEAEGL